MTQQPDQQPTGESTEDRPSLTSDREQGTGPSLTMDADVEAGADPVEAAHAVNPGGGPAIEVDEPSGDDGGSAS